MCFSYSLNGNDECVSIRCSEHSSNFCTNIQNQCTRSVEWKKWETIKHKFVVWKFTIFSHLKKCWFQRRIFIEIVWLPNQNNVWHFTAWIMLVWLWFCCCGRCFDATNNAKLRQTNETGFVDWLTLNEYAVTFWCYLVLHINILVLFTNDWHRLRTKHLRTWKLRTEH